MRATLYPGRGRAPGYMLTETLVYMALLFMILGLGYAAVYNYIDHSLVLRHGAADISRALEVGERWRADVRAADSGVRLENTGAEQCLYLAGRRGEVAYRFSSGAVSRRVGSGPWGLVLADAKASNMVADRRQQVTAWRWDLELQPRARASVKASHFRPLFTFITVPQTVATP
jgi:hypothetical protein